MSIEQRKRKGRTHSHLSHSHHNNNNNYLYTMMNKKQISILIGIVLVVALGLILFTPKKPASFNPNSIPRAENFPVNNEGKHIDGNGEVILPNQTPSAIFKPGENVEITYTTNGFSPATVTVSKGKVVTFKNFSDVDMWPASGPHPKHDLYPVSGGCINSIFDACKDVKSGKSWSFQFDLPGTWKYHDHLAPGNTGTIIVK